MVEVKGNNAFFIWDISANVGSRQPNKLDDVELVRFGYYMISQAPEINTRLAGLKPLLSGLSTSGGFDQNLEVIIRAHESIRGGSQDGYVSKSRVDVLNRGYYDRNHSWIIVSMNNFMRDFDYFPRLDLHAKCGPELKRVVKSIMLNK
jgi:hypothetical protein